MIKQNEITIMPKYLLLLISIWALFYPLFLIIIQMMIGAPNSEVTALIGSVPWNPGICDMKSQINRIIAPHRILEGMIIR